jgi:hypothetical protein
MMTETGQKLGRNPTPCERFWGGSHHDSNDESNLGTVGAVVNVRNVLCCV